MFSWIKRYLPKGLYWRAALILVLPVFLLQIIVSFVFIQRHFEGVTEQLTGGVIDDLRLIEQSLENDALSDALKIANALGVRVVPVDMPFETETRRFYDLSGIIVLRELRTVQSVKAIDLPDDDFVTLGLSVRGQDYKITVLRKRVSASNPHQLIVNMVFFGILLTVIAFLYLRNQLRPITRLAQAADAFGRGVHIPYRPSGATEVRAAGRAFLDMRSRIERHIEQRTLILSGVSHDLRTPLTRLKLGLSFLPDQDREPLEKDVEDMRVLLDEFLVFAKALGEDSGAPEPVKPADLIHQLVSDYARMDKVIELPKDRFPDILLMARPTALKRALENLINNAFRYGDRVQLFCLLAQGQIVFEVHDNGPGIPNEKFGDALKPFHRLDPARNQNKGAGVGLGLPITEDIARAHGGWLELGKSNELGGLLARIYIAIER